jgi:hypothetical protein
MNRIKLVALLVFTAIALCSSARADYWNTHRIEQQVIGHNYTEIPNAIKSFCARKWPSRPDMEQYCEQQQTSAAAALRSLMNNRTDDDPIAHKVGNCLSKWDANFEMVEYCVEN